jgi:YHS domain-containing protein
VQDPERYLKERKVTLPSIFPKAKSPLVDSSLREKVNFEIYYFSSAAEKELFKKNTLKYCGQVTDPITLKRFRPTASSPKTVHGGRIYYFSADSTRARFLANPQLHQDRRTGTS